MVVGRAVVSEISEVPEVLFALAILGSLTGVGPVVGPLLGTVLLAVWGWQSTFVVLGIMASAVLVAVLVVIPETLPAERRHTQPYRSYPAMMWSILRTPSYLVNATFIWLGFAMVFGYISASSFIVQAIIGWGPGVYSLIFAINGGSMAVFGFLTGVWAHRFSARFLLGCSIALQAVAALLLLVNLASGANSPWLILPALWCIAVGMAFVFGPATGNALAEMQGLKGRGQRHQLQGSPAASVRPLMWQTPLWASNTRRRTLAGMGGLQFVAGGIAAPLVGIAGETSMWPLTALAVGCTVVNLLVFSFGRAYTR